jgi:hypothetical protein
MKNNLAKCILEYRYETNAYIALLLESGYFDSSIPKELRKNILKNVILDTKKVILGESVYPKRKNKKLFESGGLGRAVSQAAKAAEAAAKAAEIAKSATKAGEIVKAGEAATKAGEIVKAGEAAAAEEAAVEGIIDSAGDAQRAAAKAAAAAREAAAIERGLGTPAKPLIPPSRVFPGEIVVATKGAPTAQFTADTAKFRAQDILDYVQHKALEYASNGYRGQELRDLMKETLKSHPALAKINYEPELMRELEMAEDAAEQILKNAEQVIAKTSQGQIVSPEEIARNISQQGIMTPDEFAAYQDRMYAYRERSSRAAQTKTPPEVEPVPTEVKPPEAPKVTPEPAPAPKPETPRAPRTDTERAPRTDTPRAPRTDTERAPRTDTERAPRTDTERAPRTDTERAPRTDTPRVPKPETPGVPEPETPRVPEPETPRVPEPETGTPPEPETGRVPEPETGTPPPPPPPPTPGNPPPPNPPVPPLPGGGGNPEEGGFQFWWPFGAGAIESSAYTEKGASTEIDLALGQQAMGKFATRQVWR